MVMYNFRKYKNAIHNQNTSLFIHFMTEKEQGEEYIVLFCLPPYSKHK